MNNDLENIPYTMVMAWGSVLCIAFGGSDGNAIAHIVLYSLFVLCRIGHSIVYTMGISKARSLIWLVGVLCSFAIGINACIASFGILYW